MSHDIFNPPGDLAPRPHGHRDAITLDFDPVVASRLASDLVARIDAEVVANLRHHATSVEPTSPPPITLDSIRASIDALRRAFRRRPLHQPDPRESYWDLLYGEGLIERLHTEQTQMILVRASTRAHFDCAHERSLLIGEADTTDRTTVIREMRAVFHNPEQVWMPGAEVLRRRLQIGLKDLVPEGQPLFEATLGPHGNDAIPAMARTVGRLIADWPKATGRRRALGTR